jgi:hypothetical protein
MIGWQHPGAFWALPLVAVPVIIHLLRLHRSERVAFPSLRFVQPVRTAAVRLRLPSDIALLIVRMAIVAMAVMAAAGPILVTPARLNAWNARTARAVVVDTSESMRVTGADGTTPAAAASEALRAELASAGYARSFDSAALGDGVARAAAWLRSAPPARRELVVLSDFQRGAFDSQTLTSLDETVGIRLVSVGRGVGSRTVPGATTLAAPGIQSKQQTMELTADSTTATTEMARESASGVRLVVPSGDTASADKVLRSVAVAGAIAGAADEPIAIRFSGAPAAGSITTISAAWMVRTILRLQEEKTLQSLAGQSSAIAAARDAGEGAWTTVARDRAQQAIVRAAAAGKELVIEVEAPVDSLLSATVLRVALNARVNARDYAEKEIGRIDSAVLSALNRPPGELPRDVWRNRDSSDARWLWLGALMLLALEQWLRERRASRLRQEDARAAA